MPTYEYQCEHCGRRFERFQAMSAPPLKVCPACRGAVQRLISGGAGIIIKGANSGGLESESPAPISFHTRCGNEQTCCGRETPCEKTACE